MYVVGHGKNYLFFSKTQTMAGMEIRKLRLKNVDIVVRKLHTKFYGFTMNSF